MTTAHKQFEIPPIIWIRNIINLLIGIGKQAFGVLVDFR